MQNQNCDEVSHPAFLIRSLLAVYVDPGSGSFYFQIIIAGITSVFFFFSTLKRKFLGPFPKSPPSRPSPPPPPRIPGLAPSKATVLLK